MSHNATIIEVLLGLTLLVILFLSIRWFLSTQDSGHEPTSSVDLSRLEQTLKEWIEKAGQVPTAAAVGAAGGSEESQKLLSEIANLKTDLQSKQQQIETLNAAAASATAGPASSGLSGEDKSKLEAQLRELQAKLSEYEIISEDIADLSFYKEQNVKLQKELEALKAGGGSATAAAAAPAAAVETAPPPPPAPKPEPEIVGKSVESAAVEAAPAVAEAATPPPAAASETVSTTVDNDLMAEFDAAVENQKPKTEAEATVDLGQMDMDKMMAEAAGIKTNVPEVDPAQALGSSLDENKLLQEAAALEDVSSEDKKLMGEFENFVKKNES
ncbi:MAG: hypothetical protein ACAH59_13845 [Pseudobdellovibrionaceae bacterium]